CVTQETRFSSPVRNEVSEDELPRLTARPSARIQSVLLFFRRSFKCSGNEAHQRIGKERFLNYCDDIWKARSSSRHFWHVTGHHQHRHVRRPLILQKQRAKLVAVKIGQTVIQEDQIGN